MRLFPVLFRLAAFLAALAGLSPATVVLAVTEDLYRPLTFDCHMVGTRFTECFSRNASDTWKKPYEDLTVSLSSPASGKVWYDSGLLRSDDALTYGASAVYKINPSSSFKGALKLVITDLDGSFRCENTGATMDVPFGKTTTLTVSLSCETKVLGTSYSGYYYLGAEVRTYLGIIRDGRESTIENFYSGVRAEGGASDGIYTLEEGAVPPDWTTLLAGSQQTFKADAQYLSTTRSKAEIDFVLTDHTGKVLASLPQRIKVNGRATTREDFKKVSLTLGPVTIPGDTMQLALRAKLLAVDGTDLAPDSTPLRYPVKRECTLGGRLFRQGPKAFFPLPGAAVELWDVTGGNQTQVARVVSELKGTFQDPDATYCFKLSSDLSPAADYQIRVRLQDNLDRAKSKFLVSGGLSSTQAHELRWPQFKGADVATGTRDLNADPSGGLLPNGTDTKTGPAAAETYWHVWRAVNVMLPLNSPVSLGLDLPLEYYLNGTGSYYCKDAAAGVCPTPTCIVLQKDVDSIPGANPTVVWHEFGHHLVKEFYGGFIPRPAAASDPMFDRNHNGFANDYSTDSMEEGIATFWAGLTSRVFEKGKWWYRWNSPTPETASPMLLESNYRSVEQGPVVPMAPTYEENAFAGLLVDLVDAGADSEPAGTIMVRDELQLEPKDILSIFKDAKPKSIGGFYKALTTKFPLLNLPESGGKPGLIDQLFLMHFIFKDANGDWTWQGNEPVGYAANGARWSGYVLDVSGTPVSKILEPRLTRENVAQIPGSYILARLLDSRGNAVDSADLDITFEFPPDVTGQAAMERVRAVNGPVHLHMPPPHYGARAVINVPGSDEEPLVVESAGYWQTVGTRESFADHTFVVPKTPAIRAFSPASAEGGTLVDIAGDNFASRATDNTVAFGTLRADIVSGSETRLTVVVPEYLSAGTVPVTVTTDEKTSPAVDFVILAASQSITPPALDFGSIAAGASAERTVTVRNTGTAPLRLFASSATNPRFSVSSPGLPVTVGVGGQLDLRVRFAPAAAGAQTGSVVISTSDRIKRSASITVSGTGGNPEGPEIDPWPAAFNFGRVVLQQTRSMTLTVKNTGTASLSVTSASATPTAFTVSSPSLPLSVPPGSQQNVEVRFTPNSVTVFRGSLTLASNDADESPLTIELLGEGTTAGGSTPEELSTDDGSPETGTVENGLVLVNRLTPSSYPARLKTIRVYMAQFTNLPNPAGSSITLMAFLDPSGSAATQINNPTLIVNQPVTLPALPAGGRGYVDFAIASGPVISSGDLYTGFASPNPAGGVGFPLDTSAPQRQRGYLSRDGGKTFQGPVVINPQGVETPVNVMLRAVVEPVESGSTCTYGVLPISASIPAASSQTLLSVLAPSGCAWTITGLPSWLTASSAGGTGNGSSILTSAPNDSSAVREAAITIAGLTTRVRQAAASPGAEQIAIPILLASKGAGGSYYTSELTLTNRGSDSVLVEAEYSPALGEGAGAALDVVPAGSQLTFTDALGYLRSLGIPIPASGDRGGTLRIRPKNGAASRDLSATIRTTTAVPEGRAGLAYPEVPHGKGLTETVYLCGLRQNAQDRSNVALVNTGTPDAGDAVLLLTVVSGDPSRPGEKTLTPIRLSPGGFTQITQILMSNGLEFTNGFVKVERIEGTASFYAYAVINDQGTSDGSFVPPVAEMWMKGRVGMTIPVMVETSSFSSELVLTNWSRSMKTLRLRFVADAVSNADKTAETLVALRASEQLILPDFVNYLRDRSVPGIGPAESGFTGALFIEVIGDDGDGLFAGARTSSPGGKGRYGLFYSGIPSGRAAARSAWLFGLQQNALTRSNFAFINTGEIDSGTDLFRIEIFDGATGALVRTLDGEPLAARQWKQISQILKGYAPNSSSGYIKVTHLSGRNPFLVYAVLNDGGQPGERTGDGAFLLMSSVDE